MEVPSRLKAARERARKTQSEVSKLINISNKTLSGYERGVSLYPAPNKK